MTMMSMGLSAPAPEVLIPDDDAIASIFDLLAIIADADAAKTRLEQIAAASVAAREAQVEAARERAALASERDGQAAAIKDAWLKHGAALAAERETVMAGCEARTVALDAREARIQRRETELSALTARAQRDADTAAEQLKNLQSINQSIRSLAPASQ